MYIDDGLLGAELRHALRTLVTDVELQARVFSRNHELFHDELLVLRRGGRSEQANRQQERKRPIQSSHERPPPVVIVHPSPTGTATPEGACRRSNVGRLPHAAGVEPTAAGWIRWQENGQVIANGRRIGDGGRGAPTMAASCAFKASIPSASSIADRSRDSASR